MRTVSTRWCCPTARCKFRQGSAISLGPRWRRCVHPAGELLTHRIKSSSISHQLLRSTPFVESMSPSVTDRFGTYLVPRLPIGQLFTVNDLAARWSVCTATIYSLAKSGRLESLRIGNSIRFKATVVVSYEQNRIGAKAERHILPRKRVS